MEENAPSSPSVLARVKAAIINPRTLLFAALAVAGGMAGSMVARKIYLNPIRAAADARYQSHLGLMRLYDLQMAYRAAHGAYANDLETLLASAPDGAQLREKLKASVDINTLAVIGDAERFRLEANVLDAERTLVKIRGPLGER